MKTSACMQGWNPQKPTKLYGNDTTIISHHPYILCHFANYAQHYGAPFVSKLCFFCCLYILYFIYNPISDLYINYPFINQLSVYIPPHYLYIQGPYL